MNAAGIEMILYSSRICLVPRKHTSKKKPSAQVSPTPEVKTNHVKKSLVAIGGMLGVAATLVEALAYFYPLVIEAGVSLRTSDPFAQEFVVRNEGFLPLQTVTFEWHPNSIAVAELTQKQGFVQGLNFDIDPQSLVTLKAHEQASFGVNLSVAMTDGEVLGADVSVRASGKLWFIPVSQVSHFTALRSAEGTIQWSQRDGQEEMRIPMLERQVKITKTRPAGIIFFEVRPTDSGKWKW